MSKKDRRISYRREQGKKGLSALILTQMGKQCSRKFVVLGVGVLLMPLRRIELEKLRTGFTPETCVICAGVPVIRPKLLSSMFYILKKIV